MILAHIADETFYFGDLGSSRNLCCPEFSHRKVGVMVVPTSGSVPEIIRAIHMKDSIQMQHFLRAGETTCWLSKCRLVLL